MNMALKDLVLLGGGHSHIEVLRVFGLHRQQRRLQHHTHRPSVPLQRAPGHTAKPPQGSDPEVIKTILSPEADAVQLTVISRGGRYTPYSGMLPGWASGFYSYRDCHIDLNRLASYSGARLVTAEATGLDLQARQVLFSDGRPPLPYNVLSVDIGITPGGLEGVPGASEHTTPVKPIDGFVRQYERLIERYKQAMVARAANTAAANAAVTPTIIAGKATNGAAATTITATEAPREGRTITATRTPTTAAAAATPAEASAAVLRVCVVGGGAGGVELAAAVRYRLEEERRKGGWPQEYGAVTVSLICRGGLLPGHPPHVRRLVGRLLAERGVEVMAGSEVVGVAPGGGQLLLRGGGAVPYDECLWCTAASPARWLRETPGLPTDAQGFVVINECLQCDGGPPEVFAAGDVASSTAHPRPKAGVFAVRQGPPLTANLRAFLSGRPLQPFIPQRTAMALISLGDRFCVVSRTGGHDVNNGGRDGNGNGQGDDNGLDEGNGPEWLVGWLLNGFGGAAIGFTGPLLWRWKDAIDRAFMRRYGEALGEVDEEEGGQQYTTML